SGCGGAASRTPVTVSVDATTARVALERVSALHRWGEAHDTTTPEGGALLQAIAAAHSAPVHVRNHFLFNTGDGTPAMKWGSTHGYTEAARGHTVHACQP